MDEDDIQARLRELLAELDSFDDPTEREMRMVYIQAATVALDVLPVINQASVEHDVSRPVAALIAAVSLLLSTSTDSNDLEVTAHQLLDAVLRDYKRAHGTDGPSH